MSLSDYEVLYMLRCEDTNIRWTGHNSPPDKDCMKEWFLKTLDNPNREIYLYWKDDVCLGYLYVDVISHEEREIAYGISEHYQGKGYASSMINDCIILLKDKGIKVVRAAISESNVASEHVAAQNGMQKSDEFYYSELPLICGKSKFYIWKRTVW